jgi:uncharacterized protein (TIGR03790 family)
VFPRLISGLLSGALAFAQDFETARVVVIANQASADSRAIAEYYALARGLAASQVCRLSTAPVEEITRQVYNREVAAPVHACLDRTRRLERTWYLVTTLGVPLKIKGSTGRLGECAAVDSELAASYGDWKGGVHPLPGAWLNPVFGRPIDPRGPRPPLFLVTRLAGYRRADALALVDRALATESRGRVALDLKTQDSTPGDQWLRSAALLLGPERVVLEETPAVLAGVGDLIGYASWGSNDRQRRKRDAGLAFLPGALVTEYVSTNGRTFAEPPPEWELGTWASRDTYFGGSPQSLSADYVRFGASGVSGHVYEPYLTYTPRPDILFPAYVKEGRNLASSFYSSIPALSWQNIVLGDPLCRLRR